MPTPNNIKLPATNTSRVIRDHTICQIQEDVRQFWLLLLLLLDLDAPDRSLLVRRRRALPSEEMDGRRCCCCCKCRGGINRGDRSDAAVDAGCVSNNKEEFDAIRFVIRGDPRGLLMLEVVCEILFCF